MATPSFNRRAAGLRSIGAKRFLSEDYARAPDALKTLLGDEYIIGDGVKLLAKMQGLRPLSKIRRTEPNRNLKSPARRRRKSERRSRKSSKSEQNRRNWTEGRLRTLFF